MLWRFDSHSSGSNSGELYLISGMAISFKKHSEAFMDDLFALFITFIRVPLVGN